MPFTDVARTTAVLAVLGAAGAAQCETEEWIASDATALKTFGMAVAMEGSIALVGAPDYSSFSPNSQLGACYVYERSPSGWGQVAKLVGDGNPPTERLGWAASLSDGRALVGTFAGGSAYVFEPTSSGWVKSAKLVPLGAGYSGTFGRAVALDGDTALVGALWDYALGPFAGAAYVFERTISGWTQVAQLLAQDGGPNHEFGNSVALSHGRALVGAWNQASNKGAAYVFERTPAGWIQTAKLLASDAHAGDNFGISVALDGARAVIGASGKYQGVTFAGAAYVFELTPSGWTQSAKLSASDPTTEAQLGWSVALDGDRVFAGAPWAIVTGQKRGAVYLFERDSSGWGQIAKLTAASGLAFDQFGFSVAVAGDSAVAGSPGDDQKGYNSGAAAALSTSGQPLLAGAPVSLSLAGGGVQTLYATSCLTHAGMPYLILGSSSGTEPGIVLGGVLLPLNPDRYFLLTVQHSDTLALQGSLGVLSASAKAQASFTLPAGSTGSLAGLVLHHAYLLLGPTGIPAFASTPASLVLVP